MQFKQPAPKSIVYVTPTNSDVQCGRGARNFQHPGNQFLRALIATQVSAYCACKERRDKTVVIKNIIESICKTGGRFLKYDHSVMRWYDGGLSAAKKRVGVAFRDASKLVKQRNQMENNETCHIDDKSHGSDTEREQVALHYSSNRGRCSPPSSQLSSILPFSLHDRHESPTHFSDELKNSNNTDILEPLDIDDINDQNICITAIDFVLDALSSTNKVFPSTSTNASPIPSLICAQCEASDNYFQPASGLDGCDEHIKVTEEQDPMHLSNDQAVVEMGSLDDESVFLSLEAAYA